MALWLGFAQSTKNSKRISTASRILDMNNTLRGELREPKFAHQRCHLRGRYTGLQNHTAENSSDLPYSIFHTSLQYLPYALVRFSNPHLSPPGMEAFLHTPFVCTQTKKNLAKIGTSPLPRTLISSLPATTRSCAALGRPCGPARPPPFWGVVVPRSPVDRRS